MNAPKCHPTTLALILNDQNDHPAYDDLVNHLSQCESCRTKLDELTADADWWEDARCLLSEPVAAKVPALAPADTLVQATLDTEPSTQPADIVTLLDPPRHPEMLGRIGKYEVAREVGRGGMGVVVKGFDSELNRPVAIKLLAPHLAGNGVARQRFIREARAAAAVIHEHVVAIHGIETTGRLPAIVMPYLSGPSLQAHVEEQGALETRDIIRIAMQIASGLSAAHAQGLVHRDIKPANILLENGVNRVQITDFGLARAAHHANLTHSGVIAGTPHFMSPEQALGEAVDHRADLFSLGAVMYFMATGSIPFSGTTPLGVLQRVCAETPQDVRELNPAIPEPLADVIEKLLSKSPADRFATALEVRQYLNDYLAHLNRPTKHKAPRRLTTVARRTRRLRGLRRAGMFTAVVVAICGVGFGWKHMQPDAPEAPTGATSDPAALAAMATMSELDEEISRVRAAISRYERAESGPWFGTRSDGFDHSVQSVESQIRRLETTQRDESANPFDREVRSIGLATRHLEQAQFDPVSVPSSAN